MKYRFMMIINWFRYLRELYEYHTWQKHLYKYQEKLKEYEENNPNLPT